MQNRLTAVKESQATHEAQLQEVQAAIKAEKSARPESVRLAVLLHLITRWRIYSQAERASTLTQFAAQKRELDELEKELAQYGLCDPAKVEEKKRAIVLAKEAAVRWTGRFLSVMVLARSNTL